jgi:hypothetical protein
LFIVDIPLEPIRWVALSLVIAVLGAALGVFIIQNELQFREFPDSEVLSMRNFEFIADNSANFTIQNSGHGDAWIMLASVNGIPVILEPNKQLTATVNSDTSAIFRITLQNQTHFSADETYQFKLVTARGTQFFYNATYNPNS